MNKVIIAGIAALAAVTLGPAPAHADVPDLDAVVDRTVGTLMAQHRIPGAAVVVVENGRTVLSRGYGVADVRTRRPVDPATPFLTGSLAKVFTTEAVLQLVAQGKLDLNADVNHYLTAFKIKDTYPGRPITLHHLLTYTAGFDDNIIGLAGQDPANVDSLAESVKTRQPARVRPPGTRIAYDNYALALAGYLVEIASGEPYAQYVAEHVFAAHDMTGSTAALPHPAAIEARLAHGYRPDGDGYVEGKGQYAPWTPSGTGPAVTPDDMGHYMIDQLGDDPIATTMRQRHFTQDPRMPGMGYVLEERPRNGRALLYKDGDVPGFHNVMALMPAERFGVFVVFNGDGTDTAAPWDAQKITNLIVDTRFPAAKATPVAAPRSGDVSRYTGVYRSTRTSHTSLTKVSTLLAAPTVTAGPDGTLTTTGLSPDPDRHTQHWIPIAPGLFQERDGQARISFTGDGTLVSSALPSEVYEKLPWYDTPALHLPLFGAGALALVLAALGLPLAGAVRRARKRRSSLPARLATLTAWTSAALAAGFLTGFALLSADPNALMEAVSLDSPSLAILPVLATAALAFAVPMIPATAAAWRHGWWTLPGRTAYTLLTLSAVPFFTIALSYHLLLF